MPGDDAGSNRRKYGGHSHIPGSAFCKTQLQANRRTYQMDAAQANNLPLVAIEPFGGSTKVPAELVKRCAEVISWDERVIVDTIRRQARHEDTQRWDTIEFKL